MTTSAGDLRGVLAAYQEVTTASWPDLHPTMSLRARGWATADEAALREELAGYLREASWPSCPVRVFWKLGAQLVFGGCNEHFARDAGLPSAAAMVGLDDFDRRLPWVLQAAKYRADDKQVVETGVARLDIVERQKSASGEITWVRAGKAPIRGANGEVIGVLGMYEVLDAERGRALFMRQRAAS